MTAPSRTGASRSSEAGSPASVLIHVMLSASSAATAASASPAWMASASRSMPPPKRWTVRSTTVPSPTGTSDAGARALHRRSGRLLDGGPTAALMRGCSAAGPTMSPSTAPASIEVSWPGSPTRISLASRRTASVSRAIRESDTIEVSSTITTSNGRRLPRSWRKRLWVPGFQPRRRWSVEASSSSRRARIAGSTSSRAASPWTASASRAAALPVGAARATSGGAAPAASACSSSSATIRATVVVLPVPGPPATTASRRSTAAAAACFCLTSGASPAEQPGDPVGEDVHAHAAVETAGERLEVRRDLLLLAPVAVEVERAALQLQRTAGPDQPARPDTAATHAEGRARGAS